MFAGNIFVNGSLSVKFVQSFSHENFPLYGNPWPQSGKERSLAEPPKIPSLPTPLICNVRCT